MTNPEIIAAVKRWQSDPRLNPLTCPSKCLWHAPLAPIEHAGQVLLECPDCDYRQVEIPQVVLQWDGDLAWLLGFRITPSGNVERIAKDNDHALGAAL